MAESEKQTQRPVRRGGLFWPVVLIGFGTIFLLNNLGYLSWDIWTTLWRVWPVFLIAAGVDLLVGRRSVWGSMAALVLILAVFAAGIWLAWQPLGRGELLPNETVSWQMPRAARMAEVNISRAAGRVQITAADTDDDLIRGDLSYRRGEETVVDSRVVGETAYYELRTRGNTSRMVNQVWGDWEGWQIELDRDTPMSLETSLGAGQLVLDMRKGALDRLAASSGAGQIEVTLPDGGDLEAEISGAVGQITVIIPEGMEARINLGAALVARDLPEGLIERDGAYQTPDYEGAENRVDLSISLAIGQIEVRWDR